MIRNQKDRVTDYIQKSNTYQKAILPIILIARKRLAIDKRSLALSRILAGLLIMADAVLRFRNFELFYTNQGVLPLEVAKLHIPEQAISLLNFSGEPIFTAICFLLYFLAGLQLTSGYYTKFAAAASFLLVISFDFRNPFVLSYADAVFRTMLFWSIFTPLGDRYSIDALRSEKENSETYFGIAGIFLIVQFILILLVNGYHKTQYHQQWLNGEAITGIMYYDSISYLLGPYLREIPALMQLGGITWYLLLLIAPLLFILNKRLKYALTMLYFSGFLFLAATVRIGAFSFVGIMALTIFLPKIFWEDSKKLQKICGIDLAKHLRKIRQTSTTLGQKLPQISFKKSKNISLLIKYISIALILVLGCSMVIQNLETTNLVEEDRENPVEKNIHYIENSLKINQLSWSFYVTPVDDRYYIFPAETENGTKIDAYNDKKPINWSRPYGQKNYLQYETYRHRFFMDAISARKGQKDSKLLAAYTKYLCNNYRWNGQQLKRFNMIYVYEALDKEALGQYKQYDQQAKLITAHGCKDNKPKDIETPPNKMLQHLNHNETAGFIEIAK